MVITHLSYNINKPITLSLMAVLSLSFMNISVWSAQFFYFRKAFRSAVL